MVGESAPVYQAAGVERMPFRRIILNDLICATLVVGTFFYLSFSYGEEITQLLRDAEMTLTLIVLAVVGVAFLWWMRRRRQRMLDKALRERSIDQAETPAKDEQQADSLPPR